MNTRILLAGMASLALCAGGAHAATNLITNGSFETGDFTGWTQGGNTSFTFVSFGTFDGISPEDGNYWASLGPVGSDGTLSQTFADVVGQTYTASFYLASDGGTPNDFGVTGPATLSLPTIYDVPASGFVQYYGTFVGTGSDTITFNFRNDPGYLGLDNVSVTSTSVPEPAAWATMLLGLGLAGAAMRRRKAVAAA